jgi:SAM-dependent methyltransferase
MMEINNNEFYENTFLKYGINAKGVHWNSKESQYTRFKVITDLIKNDIENSSIIDVGCGFAEYLNYLYENNLVLKNYLGIDSEEFMINICKRRFTNNHFIKCDILKNKIQAADYLICSGTLNILKKDSFLEAINNCFKVANKGLIFNFLTNKSCHNLSIEEIYIHCKQLSKKVIISDDYLHNDCTIFIKQ